MIVRKFKFDERAVIENMIKAKFVDLNNVTNTIYYLAKYNYHILNLKPKANYNAILKYITENCPNIREEGIYADIESCINSVKKRSFVAIDEVCITRSELEKIQELGDIRQEKAMFVILAAAKHTDALSEQIYNAAFLTNTEICRLARLTIPAQDRDAFMQFAYDKGLLIRHVQAGSNIKKVSFISYDEKDEVVLRLKEGDFKDLAYTYLAYLTPDKFKRCFRCKRWMRNKNKGNELCSECRKEQPEEDKVKMKTIECVDCGKEAYVDTRNMTKCRCDDCQHEADKIYHREYMKNRRNC